MKPVHLIGVPLDLGGGRRGVDMGPSAFRIAGIRDQIAALGRVAIDKGDLPAPIPETQRPADTKKKYIRDIAQRVPTAVRRGAEVAGRGGVAARARRRSQPRGGIGGGQRRLAASHDVEAARPDLGRRARRHEHALDDRKRQRARHAARGAARPGAARARVDRIVAVGDAAEHRARRHSQPRSSVRRSRSARRASTSSR